MMNLSQVSRTAILILICRAILAERYPTEFGDPMAVLCLERLISGASEEDRRWILREKKIFSQKFHEREVKARVRTGNIFDRAANRFIAENPNCTVINLACGFDTRFWRINHEKCRYIELDLPEVVKLKKELLKDHLTYEMIGASVLDTSWIDRVTQDGKANFILLAEGLFMFIPRQDVIKLFREISQRFTHSQFVLDAVPAKYLKGIWKLFLYLETRITWRLNVTWVYGIKDPQEIETYGSGFKVMGVEKSSTGGPVITVSIHDPAAAET